MTDEFDIDKHMDVLTNTERNQFRNAQAKPKTRLRDALLKNLIDGDRYYPISTSPQTPGRNHLKAVAIAEGKAELSGHPYFANALTITDAEYRDGTPFYPSPSRRVRFGKLQIYTFEFDYADLAFFRRQLSWLRTPGKKTLECPIGKLVQWCSQFSDFRGTTVCWSGNKSLHIHVVFEMATYLGQFPEPEPDAARAGFIEHWARLEKILLDKLDLTGTEYRPDRALRLPEQYRRLPGSVRVIDNGRNFFGIPDGTVVPQIALWEHWLTRAPKGATELFHSPTMFVAPFARVRSKSSTSTAAGSCDRYSCDEIRYCEDRLREMFPVVASPSFHALRFDNQGWAAFFRNSVNDANPASVMRENYSSILIQGGVQNGELIGGLDVTLGELMEGWVNETRSQNTGQGTEHRRYGPKNYFERKFAKAANDDEARVEIKRHLPFAVLTNKVVMINGPEGATKTSVLLRYHHQIVRALESDAENDRATPRRALYAFMSYRLAREKCDEFNAIHNGGLSVGVILPSFAEAYRETCEHLGIDPLSRQSAAQSGYASLWMAIEAKQQDVIQHFKARHKAMWDAIGDREPVCFSVHSVLQGWQRSTYTRLMWAPSFWTAPAAQHAAVCRSETRLSLAVHDEVSRNTFAGFLPATTCDWLQGLRAANQQVWDKGTLLQKDSALKLYRQHHTSSLPPLGLDDVCELLELDFSETCITENTGEYGECTGAHDIYAKAHGKDWRVARRTWWRDIDADRVVFSTTEAVPVAVAEKVDPDIRVFNLARINEGHAPLAVYPRNGVTSENLENVIAEWHRDEGDDWFVVSNKVGQGDDRMSHAAARGSNKLAGRKIVQTMTFMAPVEYEEMQAVNAWCGRRDLVRLRHIDELNQTCGRNLGFRYRAGAEHALLIGHRLKALLQPAFAHCRYDWKVHNTPVQRENRRRKSA